VKVLSKYLLERLRKTKVKKTSVRIGIIEVVPAAIRT
jgi:hypothetical protein